MTRVCAICDGREAGLFDSLCAEHYAAVERPTSEQMRESMERGRRDAEAYRQAMRYRRIP